MFGLKLTYCLTFDMMSSAYQTFLCHSDGVFGSELAEEVEKSRLEAPWVVIRCVQEIEKWCHEHSKLMSPSHTHFHTFFESCKLFT